MGTPLVGVVMGSQSDWPVMQHAVERLEVFGVAHEARVVSAHRTPAWMTEYAAAAETRGLEVIIAGAGGAAHLPGMVASHTILPVIGVPIDSSCLQGLDALLSSSSMKISLESSPPISMMVLTSGWSLDTEVDWATISFT